jgi:simple sugar transport system permease protein
MNENNLEQARTLGTDVPVAPLERKASSGIKSSSRSGILRTPTAGVLLGTLFVYLFFAITAGNNGFVTLNATAGWANQASELAIVAIPVALLLIAGEFDLSIASIIGMASLVVAIATGTYGLPLIASILLAVALSLLIGAFNGVVTVRTKLPSFIVTLASYMTIAGITLVASLAITNSPSASFQPAGFWKLAFAGSINQFSASIIWAGLGALVAGYVLARTVFGNWIFATGGDVDAARSAGVPTDKVKIILFMMTALGASALGVIQAIKYNGGQVGQGSSFLFDSIIVAVIGGVLLQGGYGTIRGVVLGSITYGIVNVGIYYTGWNSDASKIIIGLLLLLAVLANNVQRTRALKG